MVLYVFMDETSRTGQERYSEDKWNFNEQPLFGLGALYVPKENTELLYRELDEIIQNEHFQGEFKWSNKAAQGRVGRIFPALIKVIEKNGATVHFEIEDKRFSIAKIITDYCVYPFYDMDLEQLFNGSSNYRRRIQYLKRSFASYITDHLCDSLLGEICDFFDSCNHDTVILKELIRKIIVELDTEAIRRYCLETIDSIERVESGNSLIKPDNLFPVQDTIKHNGMCTSLTIDPHTDCFSDLICKATMLFTDYHKIECIHDVQDQWKPALDETIERIKSLYPNYSITLSTQSGYHTIVNTVDYISGYLNQSIKRLMKNSQPISDDLKKICNSNITLVTSVSVQEKIWPNNPEVKVVKNLYDTIGLKEYTI